MAAHTLLDWKPAFLKALAEWPIVDHACTAAGVHRSTAYRARQADPHFAEEWHYAMESGIDRAESEAWRRGVEGFEEPVVYRGQVMYRVTYHDDNGVRHQRPVLDAAGQPVPLTIRRYSDRLLELLLRGRRKNIYSDRIEHTGAHGRPLVPTNEAERALRVQALLALAQQREEDGAGLC